MFYVGIFIFFVYIVLVWDRKRDVFFLFWLVFRREERKWIFIECVLGVRFRDRRFYL